MVKLIILIGTVFAGFLFILAVSFDVWVYLTTKDIDFVLSTWMNKDKASDPRLLPKQAVLLKTICFIQRGLKYFFYIVIIPVFVLLAFKVIGLRVKNG